MTIRVVDMLLSRNVEKTAVDSESMILETQKTCLGSFEKRI